MTDPTAAALPSPGQAIANLVPRRSAGLKLLLVCALALLMAIPALFVFGVVMERVSGADRALSDVSQKVGGQQSVLGPVLAVPFSRAPDPAKPNTLIYGTAIAYAETGEAVIEASVEERSRGIYLVPVFTADMKMQATFEPSALRGALPSDATPLWADARVYFGVSDTRGIQSTEARVDGRVVDVAPAPHVYSHDGSYQPVPHSGVTLASAEIADLARRDERFDVSVDLVLTGAQRFSIGPFAKDTAVSMTSDWPDPSFTGGVIPSSHTAGQGPDGFSAEWRVPYLARGIPGAGSSLNLSEVTEWNRRDMAVRFMREANPYQSVQRALKYAAMFIGFVFLAYFLFEVTSGLRAHPAQYVLVGLAQAIFYLLLLALAERIGFDLAFAAAAALTVLLTSGYAASVFRSRAYGVRALMILSGIYALIFTLMRAEDHALLAGAFASFAAIALTMWMTRKIDWYGEARAAPAAVT